MGNCFKSPKLRRARDQRMKDFDRLSNSFIELQLSTLSTKHLLKHLDEVAVDVLEK